MKFINFIFLFILSNSISFNAEASVQLNLETIKGWVKDQYPEIKSAEFQNKKFKDLKRSTLGAYDFYISGDIQNYSGSYNQNYQRYLLNKPFRLLNFDFFGGFESGTGYFKPYQEDYKTSRSGTSILGFDFSLLQNALFDERRLFEQEGIINLTDSELELLKTSLSSQMKAAHEYLDWYIANERLRVRKDLLKLAEKREGWVNEQYRSGNASQFIVNEYKLTLYQRQGDLVQAEADLESSTQKLCLFFKNECDTSNNLKSATRQVLPKATLPQSLGDLEKLALENSIELKKINLKIQKSEYKKEFYLSQRLPKLDFKFQFTEDNDRNIELINRDENKAQVSFEIPLENNKNLGLLSATRAEISSLEQEKLLLTQKIKADIYSLYVQYEASLKKLKLAEEEFKTALWLQNAELTRFKIGQSQQIFLNIREQDLARAELNFVQSQVNVHKLIESIRPLVVQEISLNLN